MLWQGVIPHVRCEIKLQIPPSTISVMTNASLIRSELQSSKSNSPQVPNPGAPIIIKVSLYQVCQIQVLCKVVGYIVCIMLTRLYDFIFYYIYLRVQRNWIIILIMYTGVFTTLHNYCSSSDSLTLKTHAFYITVRIRTNYCLTLKLSLLYKVR